MTEHTHIPDDELLLEADSELSAARAAQVRRHLAGCAACRDRRAGLERTLALYTAAYHESDGRIPSPGPARARLLARMRSKALSPSLWMSRWIAASLLVAAAGLGLFWHRHTSHPSPWLPNAHWTPGAAQPLGRAALCSAGEPEAPPVSPELARRVFDQYGIGRPAPRAYEVDYLISPALGGVNDIRNLWPQPYSNGIWNARVKDALEDRLRTLVCENRLDLAVAQHDIAADWVAAYRKYFQTDQPLGEHLAFVKDRPWE